MKLSDIYAPTPLRLLLWGMAVASAAVLLAALVAQYGFGLYPCELCIYQRYPYAIIAVLAPLAACFMASIRWQFWVAVLCGLLFFIDAGIAFYHAGVEVGWFPGPSGCSNTGSENLTLEEMRAQILNAPLVPCDQAMAHILGLSLAAWNAIIALLLAVATFCLLRKIYGKMEI